MPGFISWAEWQIQYNASLRSEHFTLGPSMWPWFRWMSTSHLYSSNQQSLTETHAHTQSHWLPRSLFLSPLSHRCSLRHWDEWEKVKQRHRETPDTGEICSHTRLFTPLITYPGTICVVPRSTLLPPSLPGRSVATGPPRLQIPAHPAPWPCSANQVSCVAERDFRRFGMEVKKVGCMGRYC